MVEHKSMVNILLNRGQTNSNSDVSQIINLKLLTMVVFNVGDKVGFSVGSLTIAFM